MSAALDKLVAGVMPHDGKRFSGLFTLNDPDWIEYEDEIKELLELSEQCGFELCSKNAVWINVMKGFGARIEEHSEGRHENDITIVLFLCDFDEDEGGVLVVGEEEYVPTQDDFVMFQSSEKHHVTPLRTDKTRISIAGLFHERIS